MRMVPSMSLSDKLFKVVSRAGIAALQQTIPIHSLSVMLGEFQRDARQRQTQAHSNPLTRKGQKYFSQNDEDGILLEILARLGLQKPGHFIEFGVGSGAENNTLILLMKGWRGQWFGSEELAFDVREKEGRLRFGKGWITRENAADHFRAACDSFGIKNPDVFSLDLDGNDAYIMETLMQAGFRPNVIVCEYNGKFPPPIDFRIAYDPAHNWRHNDYFGASLQAFVNVLAPLDYRLVACNITGINAFFVHKPPAAAFADVPASINDIFVPANYGIVVNTGHPTAPETIKRFL
jgi:hypothetical protein